MPPPLFSYGNKSIPVRQPQLWDIMIENSKIKIWFINPGNTGSNIIDLFFKSIPVRQLWDIMVLFNHQYYMPLSRLLPNWIIKVVFEWYIFRLVKYIIPETYVSNRLKRMSCHGWVYLLRLRGSRFPPCRGAFALAACYKDQWHTK